VCVCVCVCVCVHDLVMRRASRIFFTQQAGLARSYIFTYFLKGIIFGKVVEHKMCLLTSLQHSSENFVILRRTERDSIISIHRSSCKVPFILVRFYGNVNLIDRVPSFLMYQIS
jgi:hypothetical protein